MPHSGLVALGRAKVVRPIEVIALLVTRSTNASMDGRNIEPGDRHINAAMAPSGESCGPKFYKKNRCVARVVERPQPWITSSAKIVAARMTPEICNHSAIGVIAARLEVQRRERQEAQVSVVKRPCKRLGFATYLCMDCESISLPASTWREDGAGAGIKVRAIGLGTRFRVTRTDRQQMDFFGRA